MREVKTSAVFTKLRRSNGEVYLMKDVAESFLGLIKSDERIIEKQMRLINDLKLTFEKFASEISSRKTGSVSTQKPGHVPESGS